MPRRLLVAVSVYVVLALLVIGWGWLLTHPLESTIDPVDDDVSRWFAGERTAWLDPVAAAGTFLGETVVGLAVGAVVAVVAGVVLRSLTPAVVLLLADFGDGGIYWLASHADPRDRPPVRILDAGLVPTHSFPSGHVGTAVAVYGGTAVVLALALHRRDRLRGVGRGAAVVLAVIPVFVAASRLYQGAHHLTDVATSMVFGTVWLATVATSFGPRSSASDMSRSRDGLRHSPVPHR